MIHLMQLTLVYIRWSIGFFSNYFPFRFGLGKESMEYSQLICVYFKLYSTEKYAFLESIGTYTDMDTKP